MLYIEDLWYFRQSVWLTEIKIRIDWRIWRICRLLSSRKCCCDKFPCGLRPRFLEGRGCFEWERERLSRVLFFWQWSNPWWRGQHRAVHSRLRDLCWIWPLHLYSYCLWTRDRAVQLSESVPCSPTIRNRSKCAKVRANTSHHRLDSFAVSECIC